MTENKSWQTSWARKILCFVVVSWIILAGVFAKYDLQISKAVCKEDETHVAKRRECLKEIARLRSQERECLKEIAQLRSQENEKNKEEILEKIKNNEKNKEEILEKIRKLDKEIAHGEATKGPAWARLVYTHGDLPGYLILLIILWMAAVRNPLSSWKNYCVVFFSAAMFSFMIGGISYKFFPDFVAKNSNYVLPSGLLLIVASKILFSQKFSQSLEKYDNFVKVTFWQGIFAMLLFTQILKGLWHRVRFIYLETDFSNFTPWYKIGSGTGTHDESFPSGHTTFAWLILPFFLLTLQKSSAVQKFTLFLIVAFGMTVASGRVVFGHHYCSDVLFASGFSIVCFILLYKKYCFQKE